MLNTTSLLVRKTAALNWVGPVPECDKRAALLIPQFNEDSNCSMERRLQYFKEVACEFGNEIDVILIDDGSTDKSLDKMIAFAERNNYPFYLAAVSPNSNKVGALHLTVQAISHDFVILSDFDTDITGYSRIVHALNFAGLHTPPTATLS